MSEYAVVPGGYGGFEVQHTVPGESASFVTRTLQRFDTADEAEAWLEDSGLLARARVESAVSEGPEPAPAWDRKLSPETYLKRYPKGPHAALAKAVIASDGWDD